MTIKEFAALCRCSTQTLRYYDKINLLKPVQVDPWSGYRYYDAKQTLDFVKIKNLQAADFSIEEIKELLCQSDQQLCEAFDRKIAEQEQKLERILQIRQSYLTEKKGMEKVIHNMTDFLLRQLNNHDGLREFGLQPDDGQRITELIRSYMERAMLQNLHAEQSITMRIEDEIIQGADAVADRIAALSDDNLHDTILLGDETMSEEDDFDPTQYETLWEAKDWDHVSQFIDNIPPLEENGDYCFFFRLNEASYRDDLAFPLYMLGAIILKRGETSANMGCSVDRSTDGRNQFALMRKINPL